MWVYIILDSRDRFIDVYTSSKNAKAFIKAKDGYYIKEIFAKP